VHLALDGIAASSTRPLALARYAGVLFAGASFFLILYALYSWWKVGQTPQGWTSLMIVVTVMGSAQLLVLGIIGQYLGRIHEQIRGRPLFVVDKVFRANSWGEVPGRTTPATGLAQSVATSEIDTEQITPRK
jgi:hypothetical protein